MGVRELSILEDYLILWTHSIYELLQNLQEITPDTGGMLSEIVYWRDITRVLKAITQELK
jgi:hypothetical protein